MAWRLRSAVGVYAAVEAASYGQHQYRLHNIENAPKRKLCDGFDYGGGGIWSEGAVLSERLYSTACVRDTIHELSGIVALGYLTFEQSVHVGGGETSDGFRGFDIMRHLGVVAGTLSRRWP